MDRYRKLGKDTLLMTVGSFGSKLIMFVFVPYYTSILSTEEYGISDLITTTVTLLLPFFTLIIFESMMRFALEKTNDITMIWNIGLKVILEGIVAFLILSPLILFTILKDYYIYILAYYIVTSICQGLSYFVRGLNKVKVYAISGIIQTAAIAVLSVILLSGFKLGIRGYLLASISAGFIVVIYLYVAGEIYKLKINFKKIDKKLQRDMLRYSVPMFPNSVCWWIANSSDRYIITAFMGASAAGVYSVAYKIPTIISTLSNIFDSAWRLSAIYDFGSKESQKFFEDIFSKMTALMTLSASFLMVINKSLSSLLFSNDFFQAWKYVPLLIFASVMHAYSAFFGSIYTSSYKTKFLAYSTIIGSLVNIVLNFVFIPVLGGFGAALATFIGYAVIWLFRMIHSRRIMKMKIHVRRDIICYILIGIQIVVASQELTYEIIISGMLFICILIIMRNELLSLLTTYIKRFMRN